MNLIFETDYKTIVEKLDRIDPIKYGSTRNYINGAVTYLSPYISRGVISTKQVLDAVLKKGYKLYEINSFVKELCWRDYFQRVAQHKNVDADIKQNQAPVLNHQIPSQIIHANTGIVAFDTAITQLYQTGYMHNHCRMYTASLVCNIAKSHWHHPAQWMYYHLLDGDWASNACSWQWVAGANSSKKYYANQENINKYTGSNQLNTYLDKTYEAIETMETPTALLNTETVAFATELPNNTTLHINNTKPTFIYNYYNLDPLWHTDDNGNRILLLEPDFFTKYPINENCINFMLALSKNINNIQIYTGSFDSLVQQYGIDNIVYKEHPMFTHYNGKAEQRDWIAEAVTGYYPSFFAYWKVVEKHIKKHYDYT